MERIVISIPKNLKAKLGGLRSSGYTASGYIRSLLERELKQSPAKREDLRPDTQ